MSKKNKMYKGKHSTDSRECCAQGKEGEEIAEGTQAHSQAQVTSYFLILGVGTPWLFALPFSKPYKYIFKLFCIYSIFHNKIFSRKEIKMQNKHIIANFIKH